MRLREQVLHAAVQHLRGPRHRLLLLQPRPLLGTQAGQEAAQGKAGELIPPPGHYSSYELLLCWSENPFEIMNTVLLVIATLLTFLATHNVSTE